MRNKFTKIIALTLVSGSILCTAAACNTSDETLIPDGYTVNITYYLTDGEFADYAGKKYLNIYYMPDSKIAEPNVSSESFKCSYTGHSLEGWFIAEKDADGNVVTDEDGVPKASSEKFDFSKTVTEDMTLVSVWTRKIMLTYYNYYLVDGKALYTSKCAAGEEIKKSNRQCYDSSKQKRTIEDYYWHYDEATDTYSDKITFPLTYEYLDSLIPEGEEPDPETNYMMLYAYVKYAD